MIIVNMVCSTSAHPQLNCCQDLVDFQEKEKFKAQFDKVLIFKCLWGDFQPCPRDTDGHTSVLTVTS